MNDTIERDLRDRIKRLRDLLGEIYNGAPYPSSTAGAALRRDNRSAMADMGQMVGDSVLDLAREAAIKHCEAAAARVMLGPEYVTVANLAPVVGAIGRTAGTAVPAVPESKRTEVTDTIERTRRMYSELRAYHYALANGHPDDALDPERRYYEIVGDLLDALDALDREATPPAGGADLIGIADSGYEPMPSVAEQLCQEVADLRHRVEALEDVWLRHGKP